MAGKSVYEVRKNIGAELAKESPVEGADLIVPVPDSGVPSAIGYAQESGLPFELGIIRNHYIGRTFIEPTDQIRHLGVKLKHNANRKFIEGKRSFLLMTQSYAEPHPRKSLRWSEPQAQKKCICVFPHPQFAIAASMV